MRTYSLAVVLVLVLAAGCAAPASPATSSAPAGMALVVPPPSTPASISKVAHPTATPEPAGDFTLKTLTGTRVTLSDLRGQWVVLNFWASWCSPCVREMPYLAQLSAERDVTVLGINVDETAEVAARFVAANAIPFPILMEPDDSILLAYGVRGLPLTLVLAPDGTIAHQAIGAINPTKFDTRLDELGIGRKGGG